MMLYTDLMNFSHWILSHRKPSWVALDRIYRSHMGVHHLYRGSLRVAGALCASATQEESHPPTKDDGYSGILAPSRRRQIGLQVDSYEADISSNEDAFHRAHGHMHRFLCKFRVRDPVPDPGGVPNRL